jgi:hypothetical protein
MPNIYGIIGGAGLLLAIGAAGGIECDTMGWGKGLAYIALGFAIMGACALLNRRASK